MAVKRQTRKTRKTRKSRKSRIGKIILRIFLVFCILAFVYFMTVFLGFWGNVPSKKQLFDIKNPVASQVLSSDGQLLGRYYVENRSAVAFHEISLNVINALIATEDARFYKHSGIDKVAVLRVFFKTILMLDRSSGGGSTLSQQIAKNLFPRKSGNIYIPSNKIREAIIASRLESIYSKEEILTLYLNTVPFAENVYGIEVAAERFYSKSPKNLSVDEAAVLIGMLKANNRYNPRLFPERSKERRDVVINLMAENEFITKEEAEIFKAKPLILNYRRISYNEGPATYFIEMIKPELLEWCRNNLKADGEPYNLYTDGLIIRTTLNFDLQKYAREAMQAHMKDLQNVFDQHWKDQKPWDKKPDILERAMKNSERYKKMLQTGKTEVEIEMVFNEPIETTLFTWEGDKTVKISPMDSIKHFMNLLNVGFMAMTPSSGEVKVWVGGIDFRYFKYDHVTSARQVGSTFKPFVYLAALESGISPHVYYPNERHIYHEYQGWSPRNSNNTYTGYYSMEGALANSVNTIAVEVLLDAGIKKTISTTKELGINSELPAVPSLALGVASISLKEMVVAYSTIVNNGMRVEPYYIVSVSDINDKVIETFASPAPVTTSLKRENCNVITHMLKSVVDFGTGRSIRSKFKIPGTFAGKTGTTQDQTDGWFMGFTPNLVTGCWVGADDPNVRFRTITYGQGSYMALPLTGRFFSSLYKDPEYQKMQNESFVRISSDAMLALNIPPYIESIYREEPMIAEQIEDIYTRRQEEKIERLEERRVEKPEIVDKKKAWNIFRNIFGKKKNKR